MLSSRLLAELIIGTALEPMPSPELEKGRYS